MTEQRALASVEAAQCVANYSNPFLFVVGCLRSGTTLLQRMLDNHPSLAVANDTHFIPRVVEGVPVGVDPTLTPELIERVRTYKRFYRMELENAAVYRAAERSGTYRELVSALYSEYGRLRGKPLAGEKTPDYVRRLPFLQALFPRAKTIHIIRDGRDDDRDDDRGDDRNDGQVGRDGDQDDRGDDLRDDDRDDDQDDDGDDGYDD